MVGSWTASRMNDDERDAGDAVGLEAVGARADRVARVVARAVGDDAGVTRVVFLDLEDDLHEVRPDVGDLREDAAGDAERRGAERLADGEADEALARVLVRDEGQDAEHERELDADEQHADAHAGLERDRVDRVGLAPEARERRARVRERVHADAEERDRAAARDADDAEDEDEGDDADGLALEHAVVDDDDGADEEPRGARGTSPA